MAARNEVSLPLTDRDGHVIGAMLLSLLPGVKAESGHDPLIDLAGEPTLDSEIPPIQLLEGFEYRYEMQVSRERGVVTTDRPEVFQPDTKTGRSGRVRPGLYTGAMPVMVFHNQEELGHCVVEVRSRKLGYQSEYRWMLRDVAEQMTEVVMDRFAVAEQSFTFDDTRDAVTLYERFAFLKSLIASDDFQAALNRIVSSPHVIWREVRESSRSGRGIKSDSYSIRQLTRPGPRIPWPNGKLETLPLTIERRRTEASTDNAPNRFVKFALRRWRSVVAHIDSVLREAPRSAPVRRGLREVEDVLNQLDAFLASELFREIEELSRFPADDQVLQKKEGYRDVYKAYIQFEVASKLSWRGGDDVYGAGQRDVATLYEYWAFLALAQQLSMVLDVQFDFGRLIELRQDGLNVGLKTGAECVLHGVTHRHGRELAVELWFNRTFGVGFGGDSAWSRSMRPDYSIAIRPGAGEAAKFEPVILHFDAKYRVNFLSEVFGGIENGDSASAEEVMTPSQTGAALRVDLLKMHAYRDAIRRSVGAYVLYPGTEHEVIREYHELLPGLGAFALRPVSNGMADGANELREFLEDVLDHVALQVSQHERGRYWLRETFSQEPSGKNHTPAAGFLSVPPADTLVLLGYVRNSAHWEWIERTGFYNLRGYDAPGSVGLGSKVLACEIVVLSSPSLNRVSIYKVTKEPVVRSLEQMTELEYPNPRGAYFCLAIEQVIDSVWEPLLTSELVESVRSERVSAQGAPVAISWLELVKHLS